MKQRLLLILIFISQICSAYQDIIWTIDFDNIRVRLHTGASIIEVRSKAVILGHVAELTSKKFNYHDTVIIDIDHDYTNHYNREILVGYTDQDIYPESHYPKITFNKKCLRIYLKVRDLDYQKVIQTLERCILYMDVLKVKNSSISNREGKTSGLIKPDELPPLESFQDISDSILCTKINRAIIDDEDDVSFATSYFFKCNAYHLYGWNLREKNRNDTLVLATVPSIFQVIKLNHYRTMIFDTDSTFYLLKNSYRLGPSISERQSLSPTYGNYMPYETTQVDDIIFIEFSSFTGELGPQPRKFLFAYFWKEDLLIHDVIERIKRN